MKDIIKQKMKSVLSAMDTIPDSFFDISLSPLEKIKDMMDEVNDGGLQSDSNRAWYLFGRYCVLEELEGLIL